MRTEAGETIKLEKADMIQGDISYNYKFLFLKALDGKYEMYLLYVKISGEEVTMKAVSEIEVLGLEKSYQENEDYRGEKIMAQKYREILEGSKKNIF